MTRKITFPIMGRKNTGIMRDFLESLGLDVVLPPPITDKTVKLGVKHSASMMCYPYKITLGNYMEALERGANTLLSYDTRGRCRFRQYSKLHEFTLRELGYDFDMCVINSRNLIPSLGRLSGRSYFNIIKNMFLHYRRVQDTQSQLWSEDKPNIGIIGELYCCSDETVNYGLETKIRRFGGNPINTATIGNFLEDNIGVFGLSKLWKKDELKRYKKQARQYFNGPLGGHVLENMYNLLWMADNGIDGIVHLLPLSCMPESTIEPYVDSVCRQNNLPLLRIPIDENSAEANLETRIETYCELVRMRREK